MRSFEDWSSGTDPHFAERSLVAFDLDDTLTERGALPGEVVRDLEAAQARGWRTCLVTGRSAGWVDALIKLLPFDGIVGENGALIAYWSRGKAARLDREAPRKLFWRPDGYGAEPPDELQDRFSETTAAVRACYPRARPASDQAFRIYDLAIDFAEEIDPPLSLEDADGIRRIFESFGAVAKVSSIHVNGWWGPFSKVDGLRQLAEKIWGLSLERNILYAGDSPNDGPLFEATGLSVGVANLKAFVGRVEFPQPDFITRGSAAEGAREILAQLPARRRAS